MHKFILLTSNDPWLPPKGGTSAFAHQLLEVYQEEIAIVSMTEEDTSTGKWIDRDYKNKSIKWFCLGRATKNPRIIPSRLIYLVFLLRNIKRIESFGVERILIDSPEAIWGISRKWESICYFFHGVNNPVSNSKIRLWRGFGKFFERYFVSRLYRLKPECILAAADERELQKFNIRTRFNSKVGNIITFPTRVDNNVFFPVDDKASLRIKLNIQTKHVFSVVGRLAWVKGWDLILDGFKLFNMEFPDSSLIFVGEGEDRCKIEDKVLLLNLQGAVVITGMIKPSMVAEYINIADLCLVGSFYEGWSVAMCEMLACGKLIVTTNISGAEDMVINGSNGYIVKERDPVKYAEAMKQALNLHNGSLVSLRLAEKYLLRDLKYTLDTLWPRTDTHSKVGN
jgi:glycosyltransferase involved in cell wall biosynthesis